MEAETAATQPQAMDTWSNQKLEEKEGSSPGISRGPRPGPHLILVFGLQTCAHESVV